MATVADSGTGTGKGADAATEATAAATVAATTAAQARKRNKLLPYSTLSANSVK